MKRPRALFFIIILITIVAATVDLPALPIKFNGGPVKIDTRVSHPVINFNLFGLHLSRDLEPKLGLDLKGGVDLTLSADVSDIPQDQKADALNAAKQVIERRVNALGVSEPIVQTAQVAGDYRIIVELPGVQDTSQARELVGQTAKLEFRQFKNDKDAQKFATTGVPVPTLKNTKPTGVDGRDLKKATADFESAANGGQGGPVVRFTLKGGSVTKFQQLTKSLIGKPLAIFLDNQVLQAPIVQSEIGADGVITGQTSASAKILAIQLNAGALPVKNIQIIQERTIGATLGQASIDRSLLAGAIGLTIVGLFMLTYYGGWGLLADTALLVYSLIVFALFKSIPITLTLAGIAGFILSIGMAVDANILIFERMKEELRSGRERAQAVEIGFSRAWNSIRDSNASSLITSGILYWFGTGSVRGFALALALGILVSMFTAITVTRTFLRFVYRT